MLTLLLVLGGWALLAIFLIAVWAHIHEGRCRCGCPREDHEGYDGPRYCASCGYDACRYYRRAS